MSIFPSRPKTTACPPVCNKQHAETEPHNQRSYTVPGDTLQRICELLGVPHDGVRELHVTAELVEIHRHTLDADGNAVFDGPIPRIHHSRYHVNSVQ